MSIKKLKEQTEKWSFSEIKLSDRWFYPGFFFWSRCNWKCKRSKQKKRRRTWQRNKRHKPFSLNTRLYYDLNRWSNTENDKWKRKTATLAEKAGHGCLLYLVLWRFVITATPEEQGILEWLLTLWNEFSCRFFFIRHSYIDHLKPRRRISFVFIYCFPGSIYIYIKNLVNTAIKIININVKVIN